MSIAVVHGRAGLGVNAPLVTIEVHLANGLPGLSLVGLPETAVKESRDRVRSAIMNSGLEFPRRRIVVNLAPADLPKDGGRFDLPIAVGILAASGQIPMEILSDWEFAGELALGGELRTVPGILPMAIQTLRAERQLMVPAGNGGEAALAHPSGSYAAHCLADVTAHLLGHTRLAQATPLPVSDHHAGADLSAVKGQAVPRRALEVAAAGGHSLLLLGPPGTGKSMLASRLPGILPPMTPDERLESAAVRSLAAKGVDPGDWGVRPFRAPHHSASSAALAGGGARPRPGEISLAHHGVLFLDELPEFSRQALEILREPIETGHVTVSRAAAQLSFPARFQLVAAMNPCPCGHLGDAMKACTCTPDQVARYRSRISGPLLDRIDLQVDVPRLHVTELQSASPGEASVHVRERVCAARERRLRESGRPSAALPPEQTEAACGLGKEENAFLGNAMQRLGLSARGYHRVLRVARTIADLAERPSVSVEHLAEALTYRRGLDVR